MSKEKHAPGFISKRLDFDNFLVSKINPQYAQFWQNTELKNVEAVDGGHVLYLIKNGKEITVFAKLVIGAEGDRSVIGKKNLGV